MNDLTTISTIFLIISLLISGYFAGLVGMPLGPIRIFFMLFFGVNALIVFGTNLAISFVMMIPTVWNNLKNQKQLTNKTKKTFKKMIKKEKKM